jgi:hypothetical protein
VEEVLIDEPPLFPLDHASTENDIISVLEGIFVLPIKTILVRLYTLCYLSRSICTFRSFY